METMAEKLQKRITVVVDPEIKAWARKEAEKRKWSMSLFCHEILREAMEREVNNNGYD